MLYCCALKLSAREALTGRCDGGGWLTSHAALSVGIFSFCVSKPCPTDGLCMLPGSVALAALHQS